MEVPSSLKRLLRLVLRGFYDIEHTLVIDLLIRRLYMTEEEIEELIKFEKKQLRNIIAQLRNEKILKARIKMETGPDRKSKKQNYYYINYRGFVNVVKYKLDHMRRKIETEERDNTKRASFICTQCGKTYTDLEADQLCDLTTGEFCCNYCGDLVEEDSSVLQKADSRLILAKFNEQIQLLYVLLKEVEELKLPAELLEPEPIDSVLPNKSDDGSNREWNSVDKNRGINSAYESMLLRERSMTVNIENVGDSINSVEASSMAKAEAANKVKKERPAWLVESTVFTENGDSSLSNGMQIKKLENGNGLSGLNMNGNYSHSNGHSANEEAKDESFAKEILEALLIYEKQNENNANITNLQARNTVDPFGQDKPNRAYLNGNTDDQDQFEIYKLPLVRVCGQFIPINEVEECHLPIMSHAEREDFVKQSQEVYLHLYD